MAIVLRNPVLRQVVVTLLVAILLLVCSGDRTVEAEESLVMAALTAKDLPGGVFLQKIYAEAFQRLGMTVTYEVFPAKRASVMADDGAVDGETNRIYAYAETHPNLIRVEEPLYTSGVLALVIDPTITLEHWESLSNTTYVVNYRRGIMVAESNLFPRVPSERLEAVNALEHGLKKLITGRCDVYVDTESVLASPLLSDEFRQAGIRIAGVMERYTVHPYLHVRHQELAPKLEAVLKEMKAEGLFETYREEAHYLSLFAEDGSIRFISSPD